MMLLLVLLLVALLSTRAGAINVTVNATSATNGTVDTTAAGTESRHWDIVDVSLTSQGGLSVNASVACFLLLVLAGTF